MDITITLPTNVTFLINNNQEVDFETVIYEIVETDEVRIPLAQKLKIKPEKIFKHLSKFVGEEITEGEIIAVKKQIFSDLRYLSEHAGIIKEINHETGELVVLTTTNKHKRQKSFFKGIIKEIIGNQITILLPVKTKRFPLIKACSDFGGPIILLKTLKDPLTEAEVKNKVIISESINPYSQSKLEALGIEGFITLKPLATSSDIPQARLKNIDDFSQLVDYNLKYCLIIEKDNNIYFYN